MNPNILNTEVRSFLEEHMNSDLHRMILKGSPFEQISVQELAEQIQSRRKCRLKLPLWWRTPEILFPPALNIEQSSSEKAAEYKASLTSGSRIVDLTGGFGVDSFYFSKRFDQVVHLEINRELQEIVRNNFNILGVENVDFICADSMEFLSSSEDKFDWIYIDPSRRGNGQERVFRLEDCVPNLLENLDLIMSKAECVLIKLAPFMDISKALSQLKNVKEVHVVAIDNEVKELLFLISATAPANSIIKAVHLTRDRTDVVSSETGSSSEINYGPVSTYLYEPNAALRKAALYPTLSSHYKLDKIHPNSHLFTGKELLDFPGRIFHVKKQISYSPKRVRKELGLQRANITTRNFHESVAEIRKRTGIKEGGEDYLFFTTDHLNHSVVLQCKKVDATNS